MTFDLQTDVELPGAPPDSVQRLVSPPCGKPSKNRIKNLSIYVLTQSRNCAKFSHVAQSYNRPSGTRKLEREQNMKVQQYLIHKLKRNDPNWESAQAKVRTKLWAADGAVACICESGMLWVDHSDLNEAYVSDDDWDMHPRDEKPLTYHQPTDTWLSLIDKRGEWYRLVPEGEDADSEHHDDECFVLISSSMQHIHFERELTVVGYVNKEGEFVEEVPKGDWTVANPTPYRPKALLS